MTAGDFDFDSYASLAVRYVEGQLQVREVAIAPREAKQIGSMLHEGVVRAARSGERHWELAFRGAVEVLLDRATFIAHHKPGDPLPDTPFESELFVEDVRFMREIDARMESGEPVSFISICPIWPFCE